jgi:membrane protease YdiL (CAAX protease family)
MVATHLGLLALSSLIIIPRSRRLCFRLLPADPDWPLHILGAVLTVFWLGVFIVSLIYYDPKAILASLRATNMLESIAQTFSFELILILAGVGLFYRRSLPQATARLGLVKPGKREWITGILSALVLLGLFTLISQFVIKPYMPETHHLGEQFGQAMKLPGHGPVQLVFFAFLFALAAGTGEELLFRGLLQPALGIAPVSLLFAVMHFHYGPTFMLVSVGLLGLCFALLRQRCNTTTSIICHVTYDFLSLLLAAL